MAEIGICAFWNPTVAGFYGKIKEKASDFVVQEITCDGKIETLEESNSKLSLDLPQVQEVSSTKQPRKEIIFPTFTIEQWKDKLLVLIGEECLKKLEELGSEGDSCNLSAPSQSVDRVLMHQAIQSLFPHLQTETISCEGSYFIKVYEDPVFHKLTKTNAINERNARKILLYLKKGASHPDAKRGVSLGCCSDKVARTNMHRVISESCSCLITKTIESKSGEKELNVFFSQKKMRKRKRENNVFVKFILKKENWEHNSALKKLSIMAKVPLSSFTYAGTKDKRAVTTQRLVAKNVSPEELQIAAADVKGIEVGRFEYTTSPLSLGMLNGNRFEIVIRNIPAETDEIIIRNSIDNVFNTGFLNYFGPQRVGMPSHAVRSHHIGLAILQQDFQKVVELLFSSDAGDSEKLKRAKAEYLSSGDIDNSLKIMSTINGCEKSILQGLKRYGGSRFDRAFENIAYGRRLMYVHAYQSYVFNRMLSLRINKFGKGVIVGDLLLSDDDTNVEIITEHNIEKYYQCKDSFSRIVLPLVGTQVQFPQNAIGDEYNRILKENGVDLLKANLKGTYRKIFCAPFDTEWCFVKENNITTTAASKSVKVSFSLGSGSYATMCLREMMKLPLN